MYIYTCYKVDEFNRDSLWWVFYFPDMGWNPQDKGIFKKNKGHLESSGIFCMYIYNIVKPTIMLMSFSLKENDGSWSTQAHVRGGVQCRESIWLSPLPKAAIAL